MDARAIVDGDHPEADAVERGDRARELHVCESPRGTGNAAHGPHNGRLVSEGVESDGPFDESQVPLIPRCIATDGMDARHQDSARMHDGLPDGPARRRHQRAPHHAADFCVGPAALCVRDDDESFAGPTRYRAWFRALSGFAGSPLACRLIHQSIVRGEEQGDCAVGYGTLADIPCAHRNACRGCFPCGVQDDVSISAARYQPRNRASSAVRRQRLDFTPGVCECSTLQAQDAAVDFGSIDAIIARDSKRTAG